jgi:hypothetical protein
MTKDQILAEINKIDAELSPENLFCDGELNAYQAKIKYHKLMKKRNHFEILLGEKVDYRG